MRYVGLYPEKLCVFCTFISENKEAKHSVPKEEENILSGVTPCMTVNEE